MNMPHAFGDVHVVKTRSRISGQQQAAQLLRHMVQDLEKCDPEERLELVTNVLKRKRLKALQRYKRIQARLEPVDPIIQLLSRRDNTRQRRWAEACAANRHEHENHIMRASRD